MIDTAVTASFTTAKFVITWWDLVDQYVLATMMAISLASFALQTAQDRLICIPAVDRPSITAGNDSALGTASSSPAVSLLKMPERRHYDYIDNECYTEMHWFSAYYSVIFLVQTVILLFISNFWQKYPNSGNALARCEHLVSELIKGEILRKASADDLVDRLKVFLTGYDKSMPWGGVTKQYRLRGLLGFIVASVCFSFNATSYILRDGWTQCKLKEIDYDRELEGSFFQCSRTLALYFDLSAILFLIFIFGHLLLAAGSFFWAYYCLGSKPRFEKYLFWVIKSTKRNIFEYKNDAAFLLHFLESTGCCIVDTVTEKAMEEETSHAERMQFVGNEAV